MNSSNSNPRLIEDIQAPGNQSETGFIEAEVEHAIPVERQKQTEQKNDNPIAMSKQFIEDGSDHNDAGLDHILQDVNQKVGQPTGKIKSGSRFSFKRKLFSKNVKPDKTNPKYTKPLVAIFATLVVVGALSVAAYYAFKPAKNTSANKTPTSSAGKVGTSAASSDAVQAAGGKLVQPGDITDLSNTLQTKINSLNDSQDFDQTPLSDQSLGL